MYITLRTESNSTVFEYENVKISHLSDNQFAVYKEDEKEMIPDNRIMTFYKGVNMLLVVSKTKNELDKYSVSQ